MLEVPEPLLQVVGCVDNSAGGLRSSLPMVATAARTRIFRDGVSSGIDSNLLNASAMLGMSGS
jgi:hypothetical protein